MMRLVCLFLLLSLSSRASHCTGGNITYSYSGTPHKYTITLNFYRDCKGIPAPTQPVIKITSSCYDSTVINLSEVGIPVEVSNYCDGAISTCKNGTYPGIEKYVYNGTINLQGICSDWEFGYYLCCRNFSITDLVNPSAQPMYIYSRLDNTHGDLDSPTFNNDPVPFICAGDYFCFDSKAGTTLDSLTYEMVSPEQGKGYDVVYSNGFSYSNPITSNPTLTFNSSTGLVCMTPIYQEIDVFSIVVNGYKNGNKVSVVERDVQVTITSCNCSPLPITLISFTGKETGAKNTLEWITGAEINNNGFVIIRNFKEIGFVKGNGTTDMPHSYSYTDDLPALPLTYYTLRQVDYDGQFTYSNTIAVKNTTAPTHFRIDPYYIENYFINGQIVK